MTRSGCCDAALRRGPATPRLTTMRCASCSSLWSTLVSTEERTWTGLDLSDDFVEALRARRQVQAQAVLGLAGAAFGEIGPLLDYGAGQGAFVAAATARGVDAQGCDLDVAPGKVDGVTILTTPAPWSWPPGRWRTVSLLDVLEHHPDPGALLAGVPADQLLVKVPTARGPLTMAARAGARVRVGGPLEAIFLVGDQSPHMVLFTRRGLATVLRRGGWTVRRRMSITEVADELPMRVRADRRPSRVVTAAMAVAGRAIGTLGRWWSDTEVVAAQRGADG